MSIFPAAIDDTDHLSGSGKIEIIYQCVAWPTSTELHYAVAAPLQPTAATNPDNAAGAETLIVGAAAFATVLMTLA